MRINNNIPALKANNLLNRTNNALDKSLEKLSSGRRINHAADDAAGMAISQKMKTQINALNQATRNASDGISVIQTAEGALSEVSTILLRMRELAVQVANGTNTDQDRATISNEIDQLNEEIQRISDTTEFNTKTLLNGNIDNKVYTSNSNLEVISTSDGVSAGDYGVKITSGASQGKIEGEEISYDGGLTGEIIINGKTVEVKEEDDINDIYEKLRNVCDTLDISVYYSEDEEGNNKKLEFITNDFGSEAEIQLECDDEDLFKALGFESTKYTTRGEDLKVELTNFSDTATVTVTGNKITITDKNNFKMKLEAKSEIMNNVDGNQEEVEEIRISILDAGPMKLQIGANQEQTMKIRIPKVDPKTLGIDSLNVSNDKGAQKAISILDEGISIVTEIRSKLGAYQNRLDHSITNLGTTSENMTEALSRIEDVDMAEEIANYTQKNVLSQAGTAMLSQANERPQTILSLLQG